MEKQFIKGEYNDTFIKINTDLDINSNEKSRKDLLEKVLYPVFSVDDVEKDKNQYELIHQGYQLAIKKL